MIVAVRHFAIEVFDIEAATKFYLSLGLNVTYHSLENWTTDKGRDLRHIVKMKAPGGGSLIEIIERDIYADDFNNAYAHTHICFQCKDIEETCKDLETKGCKVLTSLGFSPDKSAKVAFYIDPFGVTLELAEVADEKYRGDPSAGGVEKNPKQESGKG